MLWGPDSKLSPSFVLGAWRKTREAFHVPFFPCGDEAEQVAIGLGAEGFSAVAVIMEKTGGKGVRHMLAVYGFQFVERGQEKRRIRG